MGGHIRNGRFVSDKYRVYRYRDGSDATPDKVVLSFHDPAARSALQLFANMTADADLAIDIKARLRSIEETIRAEGDSRESRKESTGR